MKDRHNKIILFGGTSEGRELAEYSAAVQAPVLVSVVSRYGEMLLPETPWVTVRQGALDEIEMERLFLKEQPELVLDATHPYAKQVTSSLSRVCSRLNIPYRRVVRSCAEARTGSDNAGQRMYYAENPEEAVSILKQDNRPVFLTTGSKELETFASAGHLQGRIYARVLPDSQVLKACQAMGICGSHLIAMQGPFSQELNEAMLRQTGAGWLVTKESGARGGFEEKLAAASACGVSVIVIGRPGAEQGISVQAAKEEIARFGVRQLHLIGLGMGGGRQLTMEAAEVLKQCDAVFGASRMLQDVSGQIQGAVQNAIYQPEQILKCLKEHPEIRNGAVIYSGDTGFYSGCQTFLQTLKKNGNRERLKVKVYPGISSVSGLCARLGISWEQMYFASGHGRECNVEQLIKEHSQVFLLLGGALGLRELCIRLTKAGYGQVQVMAGIRLGYPDEQLIRDEACHLTDRELTGLISVILIKNEDMGDRA